MKFRGQLAGQGASLVLLLVFAGILLGAGAIAIGGIGTSAQNTLGLSAIYNGTIAPAVGNSSFSLTQFSTQLPTIGIIGGISLLVLALFVGFGAFLGR